MKRVVKGEVADSVGFVILTDNRQVKCVAGFDKQQAQVAWELLNQPRPSRVDYSRKLARLLASVGPFDERGNPTVIKVSSPTPLVEDVGLYYKCAILVAWAMMYVDDGTGLDSVKAAFRKIADGLNENLEKFMPLLHAEGFKKRGV